MSNRNKNTVNKKDSRNNQAKKQGTSKPSNQDRQAMKVMDQDDPKFAKLNRYNDGNDPDYYFTDKALAEQAATFPFVYFLGTKNTIGKFCVPTVEVIRMNPSLGVTPSDDDGNVDTQTGANMAAQKLYTRLSVASGRTASYQPNDVLMSIAAATSLAEGIEYARRFFGVATTYSVRNRVFAWRILSMLANAPESFGRDFVTKMADYRMELNMIITKLNQIPLFADMGFVRKSLEMYQKIYMDETSDTAQIYAYSPYSIWQIDETTQGGTTLKSVELYSTTFQGLLDKLNACADALLNSTTLNMVYADIFNYQARFSAKFITLDYVLEGYSVIPEYNERALQQIHNAVIVSAPLKLDVGDNIMGYKVTPSNDVHSRAENGLILYNPMFGGQDAANGLVFDFETSTPDLVDKIDNIKFAALKGIVVTTPDTVVTLNATLPDHYIVDALIFGATPTDQVYVTANRRTYPGGDFESPQFEAFGAGEYSSISANSVYDALLSKFNHNFLGVVYNADAGVDDVLSITGDLNYFTSMPQDHFKRITDLEYQGLFELR